MEHRTDLSTKLVFCEGWLRQRRSWMPARRCFFQLAARDGASPAVLAAYADATLSKLIIEESLTGLLGVLASRTNDLA